MDNRFARRSAGAGFKENVDMDELISKKAVIEAIEKARANVGHNLERSIGKSIIEILDDVGEDVGKLPSALGTNLAEVGTDCISRQAAIDIFDDYNISVENGDLEAYCRDRKRLRELPPAQPEPLTDKEQRIFLAAMGGEEKVCKQVDEECRDCREPYEDSLVSVCREITRKVKGALWTI